MPVSPPSSSSPRPRAGLWLSGAAALALAVQAIFLLMPEPKSADAVEPDAPETTASLDSTAFLLEEDTSVLPTEAAPSLDSTAASPDTAQTTSPVAPPADSSARPTPPPSGERRFVPVDSVPSPAIASPPDSGQ